MSMFNRTHIVFCTILIIFASLAAIEVTVEDPFPEGDGFGKFAYSVGNALHVKTRHATVLRLLPFPEKQKLDSAQFALTERTLRSYPLFYKSEVCLSSDSTIKSIHVGDFWTTKPNISASYIGNKLEWQIGLDEENFAGLGTFVSLLFANKAERKWWQWKNIFYGAPIDGSNLTLTVNKNDREFATSASIEKFEPRLENERSAFAIYATSSHTVQNIYYNTNVIAESFEQDNAFGGGEFLLRKGMFYGGLALDVSAKKISRDNYKYNASFITAASRIVIMKRSFSPLRNVDNFRRIEDISSGICVDMCCGASVNLRQNLHATSDYNSETFLPCFAFSVSSATDFLNAHYSTNVSASTIMGSKQFLACGKVFFPTCENSLFRVAVGLDAVFIEPHAKDIQVISHSKTGFRGYEHNYALSSPDGGGYYKLTFEARSFPDMEILTMRSGFSLFTDYGYVYNSHPPNADLSQQLRLWTVGIGLQLCSTRSTTGNVNRFDLTYTPETQTFAISVSSGQVFRFFAPTTFSPIFSK